MLLAALFSQRRNLVFFYCRVDTFFVLNILDRPVMSIKETSIFKRGI